MGNRRRTCQTCRHAEKTTYAVQGQTILYCRRRSPLPSFQGGRPIAAQSAWPQVLDTDWCGEYGANWGQQGKEE